MPVLLLLSALAAAPPSIAWQPWGDQAFATAAKQHKLVLLEVEAVWCHWCHVQDETTYRDQAVVSELAKHFIPVKVDQDAQPALSQRYLSWGWPAIVLFTADGKEILKHRGYAEPAEMLALLRQAEKNPHPQVDPSPSEAVPARGALSEAQRTELLKRDLDAYDPKWGGWGSGHKMLDFDELELALTLAAQGDERQARMARETLRAAAGSLFDPTFGGVSQYSATPDWATPHYERLLSVQADAITLYARAYALWGDPDDLGIARGVASYLKTWLTSPESAAYVSQDADVSSSLDGAHYYALSGSDRLRLKAPPVDKHLYARESGLAALALIALSDALEDSVALVRAGDAIDWARSNRRIEGGGYRHGDDASAPLALADTLSMGRALLELYAATGQRLYLTEAAQAAAFIASRFEAGSGYASEPASTVHVFGSAYVSEEDNAALARWANHLFHYTGQPEYRALAEKAMRYLTTPQALGEHGLRGEILLADQELATEPLHVTVVGRKDDASAAALFREARRTPVSYLRTDWLDAREPPLPNLTVTFPPLSKAAAFVCGKNSCSLPQLTPEQLRATLKERR